MSLLDVLGEDLDSFARRLKTYAAQHPEPIFTVLRGVQPILVVNDFALVTRFDDVQEVLERDDAFDVPYEQKMRLITDGENFFLGMRDTPHYTLDHTNTLAAVRRDDVSTTVLPLVAQAARALVAQARGGMDVVTQLTQKVPAQLVGDYFGTPGPSAHEMVDWTAALFWFLFLDPENDPSVRARALSASHALNGYVDAAVAERKRHARDRDDVLSRFLALQAAGLPGTRDLDIRNNLIGLIIGAIPTTATAAALVLDELLDRPDALAGAQAAARGNDDGLLARHVFEAFRFRPMTPGIFRVANQDYAVAKGEMRETTIRAGTTVVASTQSAMFDHLKLDEPNAFRLDRSARSYMHFGHGLHACFGRYINQVQIPQILKPLLQRTNLKRAAGEAGRMTKNGPFAGGLAVTFE